MENLLKRAAERITTKGRDRETRNALKVAGGASDYAPHCEVKSASGTLAVQIPNSEHLAKTIEMTARDYGEKLTQLKKPYQVYEKRFAANGCAGRPGMCKKKIAVDGCVERPLRILQDYCAG